MAENRAHLRIIIKCICWLGQQNLALRGHNESDNSLNKGNFLELTEFLRQYVPDFDKSCKSTFDYRSPKIQNELIDLVASEILLIIRPTSFFSLICDETADRSKIEQVSVC